MFLPYFIWRIAMTPLERAEKIKDYVRLCSHNSGSNCFCFSQIIAQIEEAQREALNERPRWITESELYKQAYVEGFRAANKEKHNHIWSECLACHDILDEGEEHGFKKAILKAKGIAKATHDECHGFKPGDCGEAIADRIGSMELRIL